MTDAVRVPQPPQITQEQLERCRSSGDYRPVLFEWYKYVGTLCNFYARIRLDSPAMRSIPERHYYVLVGLLNRCARLMLANVALSHKGLFGETTAILDRCIFESAVKLQWLCHVHDGDAFFRFIADGLKTELEFKDRIEEIVTARGGGVLEIERGMLASIDSAIAESGLSEDQIRQASKLPNLADLIKALGRDRLFYIIGQKIGSHHVHGTWASLCMHYLEEREDGMLVPRDHDCPTHVNQFVFFPLVVLDAIRAFGSFICADDADAAAFSELLKAVGEEIKKLNAEVVGTDFDLVKEI